MLTGACLQPGAVPDSRHQASDEGGWPICTPMMHNATLRDAVAVIGSHYPVQGPTAGSTGPNCITLNEKYGKPLWTSEGWNLGQVNDYGGGTAASTSFWTLGRWCGVMLWEGV